MVDGGVVTVVTEEVVAAGDAAGGRERYEASKRERRTICEARNIFRPSGWLGGGISEEAVESVHGVGSGGGLLRGHGTGWQETRVHGTAVVQQVTYGYLEVLRLGGGG
jgi:hypothetical protein